VNPEGGHFLPNSLRSNSRKYTYPLNSPVDLDDPDFQVDESQLDRQSMADKIDSTILAKMEL